MGTKTGKCGNCQCCGREFAVVMISGDYRVSEHDAIAGDYYRNTCPGSDFAPVQIDRRALDNTCRVSLAEANRHYRVANLIRQWPAQPAELYTEEQKSNDMRLFSKRLEAMGRVEHGKPLKEAEKS